jgi:16S rRNA (cytidine1402-2'-O)-methyltransferase
VPLAVCATPIGNLEDVTLRLLAELREADVVLCEDTRHTQALLQRHGIRANALLSYHRHNEASRADELLARLRAGERVALVSDAGTPLVNDPGARLVHLAAEAGLEVTVLPGPSAVESALVVSGLAIDGYRFIGWLPRKMAERLALWDELSAVVVPIVAFESPRRLPASLASLASVDPSRTVAVCRELTKRHEEVARGSASELAERFASGARGEITVVIGAAARQSAVIDEAAVAAVEELVGAGAPRRVAADVVARLTGASRNDLYRMTL